MVPRDNGFWLKTGLVLFLDLDSNLELGFELRLGLWFCFNLGLESELSY